MEIDSQGGIDYRELSASVKQEFVWPGMVNGHLHDHLIAVDKPQRYTGNISWTVGSRTKRGDQRNSKSDPSKTLETCQ